MLNERIRRLRKERGYSQEQMARKLHVTQGAVSQWENGVTTPSADQIAALADLFGITTDTLLGRPAFIPDDDDIWELRERLRRDPDMRMLFSTANKASADHIRAAAAMLKALEPPESEVE